MYEKELQDLSGRALVLSEELMTNIKTRIAGGITPEKNAELKDRHTALELELKDIHGKEEDYKSLSKLETDKKARSEADNLPDKSNPGGNGTTSPFKSIGELFAKSKVYQEGKEKGMFGQEIRKAIVLDLSDYDYIKARNYKQNSKVAYPLTTDATNAGIPPYIEQLDIYIPSAQVIPTILPYLPTLKTSALQYEYRQETAFNNNVGAVDTEAGGGTALPQSDLKAALVPGKVRVIGHNLKVSLQELEDVPRMQMTLNTRGELMMDQGLENQILTGSGSGENMTGFYNAAIGSYARGTNNDSNGNVENNINALYRGIVACRVTGRANPNLIVLHDNNMTPIVLLQDALGNYIYGDPTSAVLTRLWGLPIQTTTNAVANAGLVGDFNNFCALAMRQGLEIAIDMINDDFTKLMRTIIMYLRANLEIYRLTAFTKVTGLASGF